MRLLEKILGVALLLLSIAMLLLSIAVLLNSITQLYCDPVVAVYALLLAIGLFKGSMFLLQKKVKIDESIQ